MKLRSIARVKKLEGKRVLLRTGMDLPLSSSKKIDDVSRLKLALPTIQYLISKKAIVIILNHFGRPKNKEKHFRHDPIAGILSEHLKKKVKKLDQVCGTMVEREVSRAHNGDVILLENIRFEKGEKARSDEFAERLARLGDLYVNDAFSNSHRSDASMVGITKYLDSYAGLLLEEEVKHLSAILEKPKRPLIAVIGGAKIETKIGIIKTFLKHANNVLVGGALANTLLKAKGVFVGKSLVDDKVMSTIKKIRLTDVRLHIPLDVAVGTKLHRRSKAIIKAVGNVSDMHYILDIGPDTIRLFESIIKKAKTILWNGPMGLIEYPAFWKGTQRIINSILQTKADIIIGGGDSIKVLNMFAPKKIELYKNVYVSTGGGAMLSFFENPKLPALRPLIIKGK